MSKLNDAIAINTEAQKTIIEISRKYGLYKYTEVGQPIRKSDITDTKDLERWNKAQKNMRESSKAMKSILKDMERGR